MALVKKLAIGLVTFGVLFTGLMGFAHTRSGRPLLRLLGRAAGRRCPLGFDQQATPAQREQARRAFASHHAGSAVARARPALGLELERSRREEVIAWGRTQQLSCEVPSSGHDLSCEGPGQTLWFDFGEAGTLIAITGVRRAAQPAPISAAFEALAQALAAQTGAEPTRSGDAAPEALAAGPLHQAAAELRCRNYYALARATNMGDGFVLTEEFRALPN